MATRLPIWWTLSFASTLLVILPTVALAKSSVVASCDVESITTAAPASESGDTPARRPQITLHIGVDTPGTDAKPKDDVVAIVKGPHLATRLIPLEWDESTHRQSSTLELDPMDFSGLDVDRRVTPITCVIARRSGQQLVTMATSTLRVDVPEAAPIDARRTETTTPSQTLPNASTPRAAQTITDSPEADPVGMVDPPLEAIALAPAQIKEQALMPEGPTSPPPTYWRSVKTRILQSIRPHQAAPTDTNPLAAPTVHFRLLANGTIRDLRLAPTSGDEQVDQAVLGAIAARGPFPPFPRTVTRPHMDVHIALPPLIAMASTTATDAGSAQTPDSTSAAPSTPAPTPPQSASSTTPASPSAGSNPAPAPPTPTP
ncbi:MAG: TonB C-terminal domain-containing protein [Nitrospiraceae bacterium]